MYPVKLFSIVTLSSKFKEDTFLNYQEKTTMYNLFNYQEKTTKNNLSKDILTGLMFTAGLFGFISGEFIISSTLFASAAISSNINLNSKHS